MAGLGIINGSYDDTGTSRSRDMNDPGPCPPTLTPTPDVLGQATLINMQSRAYHLPDPTDVDRPSIRH